MFSVLFMGLIGIATYAQGLWNADSTTAAINPSTEIPMGITGLACMHSDVATIMGKGDTGAVAVEYDGVTYDNKAFLQGTTNGMYYAFSVTQDGTLNIYVKMGPNKKTFIVELTNDCPDNADIATLTTNIPTADGITTTAAYFTTPSVYDTDSKTSKTWDGTVAPVTVATYMVFSWSVTANKTYIAGCFGSKMMLKSVNFKTAGSGLDDVNAAQATDIFPNPADGNVIIKMDKSTEIGIYNPVGLLMKQQWITPSDNNVDISGLMPGKVASVCGKASMEFIDKAVKLVL